MIHRLALLTISVIIASFITVPFSYNPVFAEEDSKIESIIDAEIEILPAQPVFKAGDTKQIIVSIKNSKNNTINVKNITVLQWPSTPIKEFQVLANNKKVETVDITVPADTLPGDYSLVIIVEDSLGKKETKTSR